MAGIFDSEHEPPDAGPGDSAYGLIRAALSTVPVVGNIAAELVQQIIAPPLAKRQLEWMREVAAALRVLEQRRGITVPHLREDQAFIDTVISASQAALRTSQQLKRESLRNAILNAALPDAPDAVIQQMFVALVDQFTDWHLRILALCADPQGALPPKPGREPYKSIGSSLADVLEEAYPDMRGQRMFYEQLVADLCSARLLKKADYTIESPAASFLRSTSVKADRFLAFIKNPI